MKKAEPKALHPKKEFKKELAGKLEPVLAELKTILGEDEFQDRVKKAVKVLAHGLSGKDFLKQEKPAIEIKVKKVGTAIKHAKKAKALKKIARKAAAK